MSAENTTGKRSSFTGKLGFVLAAAGSAVGLGNIWRFPYLTAQYGGGIFLLIYIILVLTFGFVLMISEIAIGRKTKQSAITAYKSLDKRFGFLGWLTMIVPVIITPYYSVIGGWVTKYTWVYLTGHGTDAAVDQVVNGESVNYFVKFFTGTWAPLFWFLIFIAITALVVFFGVEKGIEKVSTVMMPILVVIVIGLGIYACTMPGAGEGLKYYFKPNFSDFSVKTVLAAMGQMFYSMSLAMGIMITYGSYMKDDISVVSSARQIQIFDTGIAILAGLAIIPPIFALGMQGDLKSGPSLIFMVLPKMFEQMKFGHVIGALFFVLVLFAALTSSISLLETVVSIFSDKFNISRKKSLLVSLLICLVLGALSSLGYGPMAAFTLLGMQMLDFFDFITNSVLMPIVALGTAVLVGFVIKPKAIADEVKKSGKFRQEGWYSFFVKWLAPILIVMILVSSVLSAFGVISI